MYNIIHDWRQKNFIWLFIREQSGFVESQYGTNISRFKNLKWNNDLSRRVIQSNFNRNTSRLIYHDKLISIQELAVI